jgi:hypothetical protein
VWPYATTYASSSLTSSISFMTTPDPGRETRVVDVRGRSVVVRKIIDTQMMLLAREAKVLQRDDVTPERQLTAVDRMFRILESAIVQPSDREFLEDLMLDGELDLRELTSFVTIFSDEGDAAKPKVRRGRTPVKR